MERVRRGKIFEYRMAELFCGPGGLAHGARHATYRSRKGAYSIRPVWANDIDEQAVNTYRLNIHDDCINVVAKSVDDIDFDGIPAFDGLCFGFPCNDFSVVGEFKGENGKYGKLYKHCLALLECRSPQWFVAENVKGLLSVDDGKMFRSLIRKLEQCGGGYDVVPHLYKFEHYNVPQYRHRIVIVGIRKDLGVSFKVPAPVSLDVLSAKKAIEDPPLSSESPNHEHMRMTSSVIERLKLIPAGKNIWCDEVPSHLKYKTNTTVSQIYRRLDERKPAYTVTGSGGGGTYMYHWSEHRALTNRERARLQTFPDDYLFCGTCKQVRKQIGMAVPPAAAKIIFNALLKSLAGGKYRSVECNLTC